MNCKLIKKTFLSKQGQQYERIVILLDDGTILYLTDFSERTALLKIVKV